MELAGFCLLIYIIVLSLSKAVRALASNADRRN